jgi:endonuclease III
MATGLLTAASAASFALFLWVLWRARARAEREAEARRALEALVGQANDLLAASLTTLDATLRRGGASELEAARDATRGAARLLEAAHAYAAHPDRRLPRAEGCIVSASVWRGAAAWRSS